MSFIRNKRLRSQRDITTEVGDIIEIDDDLYVVTNINPLELTDIEHYGRKEEGDY